MSRISAGGCVRVLPTLGLLTASFPRLDRGVAFRFLDAGFGAGLEVRGGKSDDDDFLEGDCFFCGFFAATHG